MPTAFDGGWGTITTPGFAHPSNGGELIPQRDEGQVPLYGGVPAGRGGQKARKNTHLLPIVIASKAWRSSK